MPTTSRAYVFRNFPSAHAIVAAVAEYLRMSRVWPAVRVPQLGTHRPDSFRSRYGPNARDELPEEEEAYALGGAADGK